ncbi:MAG: hypothetical protein Kow0013_09950 [Pararhodobacter sp.]
MTLSSTVTAFLVIAVLLVGYMAYLFWTDPERGLRETTHRLEKLPYVLADRYTSFAVLGLGMILFGDYPIITVYFLAGAIMGLADGAIYARAGYPHVKHTASGVLSLLAMIVTAVAWATAGGGV